MITTIIFDAFGTLFEVTNGGSAKYIIDIINSCGHCINEKAFLREWKDFYKAHTNFNSVFLTERDIFALRIKMFYDRYNIERNPADDRDYLIAGAYNRKIYAEVLDVIAELRKKYNIFIGSNTDNDVLTSNMEKNHLIADKVYTSENLKSYKPAPDFFMQILLENNLETDEVIFVGDSLIDDVYGPQEIGIKSVWLNRNGENVPEGIKSVSDLREFADLLDFERNCG